MNPDSDFFKIDKDNDVDPAKVTKANKKPIIFLFNFVYIVFVSGFTPLDPDPNPFPYLPKNE